MSLTIRKLTSRIGAVVDGVDFRAPTDPDLITELRDLLSEHKVLAFDKVDLNDEGQQRVARWFGELTTAHPTIPSIDGAPYVLPVDSEYGKSNQWHTDVTFVVNPPQVSTLRSIVIPPYGGETLFANGAAAYEDLPDPLRDLADSLWAVHSNGYDYAREFARQTRTDLEREQDELFVSTVYETEHPVVRVHPLTGERGLFIGGFVQQIQGLSKSESVALTKIFQSYVTRPENVLRWAWSPNQLVIFDNRITQHYAIDNYDNLPRRLNRVTVAGDIPVGADGRRSRALAGDSARYSRVLEPAV
ncbi:MAG TPA: TauD/TfdA family dioxygenase [Pseudonocardia sp.]